MRNPFRERRDLRDLKLNQMFETRSAEWERVGLAVESSEKAIRRAQRQMVLLLPLLIGVLVAWGHRVQILGLTHHHPGTPHHPGHTTVSHTPVIWPIGTAVVLMVIGWGLASAVGRAAAPTFMRRLDPGTAGTVGFLLRLLTMILALLEALHIAGLKSPTLAVGGAFTAVIFGLAAQQTLGNLIAGMVLISARPFRVGVRIRLQAGSVGGSVDGVVSSLGLLYTTLARGDDRILIPNNIVLSSAIVPIREPDSVDVRVRLSNGIRPSRAQAILDAGVTAPTRAAPRVLLEEIDGDDIIVRIQATPERADGGAQLADEIIVALTSVTGEHHAVQNEEPTAVQDEHATVPQRPVR